MIYLFEAFSGEKLNLKLLNKEDLSKMGEIKASILEILARNKERLFSARMIQRALKEKGIDSTVDNIRYHVNELVRLGLVKRIKADKRLRKYDFHARHFYRLNDEYSGFYYIYPVSEFTEVKQRIPAGRYDLLVFMDYDVLNEEGDIAVSEFFIFVNTGDKPIEKQKHWFFTEEGFVSFQELGIEAFDCYGKKLRVEPEKEDETQKNVYVTIYFSKPVRKNEIYMYWYRRKRKGAIALKRDRIYYDVSTPAKAVLINISLSRKVKGIKRLVATFKDKSGNVGKTSVQPFWYVKDSRVGILWYIPEPISYSTYTMEWESVI